MFFSIQVGIFKCIDRTRRRFIERIVYQLLLCSLPTWSAGDMDEGWLSKTRWNCKRLLLSYLIFPFIFILYKEIKIIFWTNLFFFFYTDNCKGSWWLVLWEEPFPKDRLCLSLWQNLPQSHFWSKWALINLNISTYKYVFIVYLWSHYSLDKCCLMEMSFNYN